MSLAQLQVYAPGSTYPGTQSCVMAAALHCNSVELLWDDLECYWPPLVPPNFISLMLQSPIAFMSYPIYFQQNFFHLT